MVGKLPRGAAASERAGRDRQPPGPARAYGWVMDAAIALATPPGPAFAKLGGLAEREFSNGQVDADRTIARGLREGDPAALDALWREYGDGVLAVALSSTRDPAAAEDVRQQVFVELWERRATYDPERGPVRAWVMTLARSRTIDHLRRRRPVPDSEAVERMEAPAREADSPESVVDRLGVADLLRQIPAQEAGLLRMRFFDGLSQNQIAERTGIPLGTVKMRMVQALERLREMLEADGGVR